MKCIHADRIGMYRKPYSTSILVYNRVRIPCSIVINTVTKPLIFFIVSLLNFFTATVFQPAPPVGIYGILFNAGIIMSSTVTTTLIRTALAIAKIEKRNSCYNPFQHAN